jgi:AcrR family transcriptional regulator
MTTDSDPVDTTLLGGRPRDARIDAAILTATADLLVEVEYPNLTLAAIAERAGTTKPAIYRRWSGKADLVHEAAFPAAPTAMPSSTGDFSVDVRAMVVATRELFTTPVVRAALSGVVAEAATDPGLSERVLTRFEDSFAAVRALLDEAVMRGAVQSGVDPDRLLEIIAGATMLRVLLRPDEELDQHWVDQIVAIVLHGTMA